MPACGPGNSQHLQHFHPAQEPAQIQEVGERLARLEGIPWGLPEWAILDGAGRVRVAGSFDRTWQQVEVAPAPPASP